jgi:urease subunit beta
VSQDAVAPGEIRAAPGTIKLSPGRERRTLAIRNTGPSLVGVGSHYHLAEVSEVLELDRDAARGMHLDIPAGEIAWFGPGESQQVSAVAYAGDRVVVGFRGEVDGPLDGPADPLPDAEP